MKKYILASFATLALMACKQEPKVEMPPAINMANMDSTANPTQDFYRFVNGKWQDEAKIPADRSRWGSFDELRKMNDSITLKVLEGAISKGLEEGTDQRKAADLFASILDTVKRDEQGIMPIKPYLAQIDSVQTAEDLQKLNNTWLPYGGAFFGLYVYTDLKNSDINTAYLGGPSLGMGRDYYQKDDEGSKEKLAKYQEHVAKMLGFIGQENSTDAAKNIVELEKRMAKASLTIVERRDARKRYNKFAVSDLKQLTDNYDFDAFFAQVPVKMDTVIVSEKNYIAEVGKILKDTPIETLKDYLKWTTINGAASYLSSDIEQANFDFYSKYLRGTEQMRPLKERALSRVNSTIGEAVGQLYVKEAFPKAAKDSAKVMIDYLLKGFEKHINELAWMSDSTKIKAQDKLSKFTVKVGYPDKWEDYSAMEIKSPENGGTYFSNMMAAQKWGFEDSVVEYGKPVDKSKWGMAPQTVNAYFNPVNNEIVFPAAILQPPFFNFEADAAVNFGGIGAVIGHEISHGFDDSGARYDGNGNLNNWWTDEDLQKFSAAGKALADQYSAYEPVPGSFVNGEFTLGENIGDLGGANVAFTALNMYLADNGKPEAIDGFTPAQRFFISWATIWRGKAKDEYLQNQVKTDPHSPTYYRAIGPLVNIDAFHEAFGTKEGDKMFKAKEDRIKIW